MKSLYLILAATAVAVTSEPQRTNNDIIWYPVDDEEGVFISTVGEKYRTSHEPKWRSHRRARYSGTPLPLPLSFDPTENHDPSFFHNINERRPLPFVQPFPEVPAAFQSQQFPVKRPNRRPQDPSGSNFPDNSFQEIINEVFDYKRPPGSEVPETGNQWGTNYPTDNQWGNGVQQPNGQNQWGIGGQQPSGQNQWGNGVQQQNGQNQWGNGGQQPNGQNQWGNEGQQPNGQNQWGNEFQQPNGQNQWGNEGQQPNGQNQWGNGGQQPSGQNQWGNEFQQPNGQNQWGNGFQQPSGQNQWGNGGQQPSGQNQWGNGGQQPSGQNQWGNGKQQPGGQNQWGNGGQQPSGQNQWGSGVQRPTSSGQNQWGTSSSSLENIFPGQRPTTKPPNQWGGPNTRPQKRPSSTGRPNKKPIKESDKLVFPGETSGTTTTSLDLIPTEPPTMSPCERKCRVTPEFNPVCGSDGVTYSNAGRLKCSQMCGKSVTLSHPGNCGRTPLVTPLVSNNRRRKFTRFL